MKLLQQPHVLSITQVCFLAIKTLSLVEKIHYQSQVWCDVFLFAQLHQMKSIF